METVFLATTALEEFWDTTKPVVFLGEWCKRYSRMAAWKALGGKTVDNPWTHRRAVDEDRRLITTVYERTLSHLGESLNQLHGVNGSNRYWRILLGPWLGDYITALYDRMVSLEAARSQYPQFSTILLSEDSYRVPRDSMEFNWICSEDAYNLQFYSKILSFWGGQYPRKSMTIQTLYPGVNNPTALKTKRWKRVLKKSLQAIERVTQGIPQIVLANSYFSTPALLKLFFLSGGKSWPRFLEIEFFPEFQIQHSVRASLLRGYSGESEFERLLAAMLPTDLPQTFVEGFQHLRQTAQKRYPKRPRAIFSSNAWYYFDDFKLWAAEQSEKGVPLIGTQHGGNYGSLQDHPSETHEVEIADTYYTWGWKDGRRNGKTKPFISTKLSDTQKIKIDLAECEVLFGSTCIPRYIYSHATVPTCNFIDYFSWQGRFFKQLSSQLRKVVRLRPHCVDYGWDVTERWNNIAPGVAIENWSVPFSESLKRCRIYVCDNLSTTFIEALVAEKPTILFWDPQANVLRPEAQLFYDELHKVGILHYSPESAANHLAKVYDNVSEWWNNVKCQKARQAFCHQFARTSPHAIVEWAKEFRKMA